MSAGFVRAKGSPGNSRETGRGRSKRFREDARLERGGGVRGMLGRWGFPEIGFFQWAVAIGGREGELKIEYKWMSVFSLNEKWVSGRGKARGSGNVCVLLHKVCSC